MEASGPDFQHKKWLPLLLFLGIALVLYLPVLQSGFASDDFKAVFRAGVQGKVFGPEFFRPLSDFTIFLTYASVGSNPYYYHLSNIILHGCSAFLLYLLAMKLPFVNGQDNRRSFAWCSSILFVTYPFHSESITWIVGRGSAFATFFALASMLFFVSNKIKLVYRYLSAGCLYFVGLLAYESILFLPLILFIISGNRKISKLGLVRLVLVFSLFLLSYFVLRYMIAGIVIGEYGHEMFYNKPWKYVVNFFKVAGRTLLPPYSNSLLLTVIFALIVISYLGTWLIPVNRIAFKVAARKSEIIILTCVLVSLIIPVLFGLSTRTSEGERLLYFPSVFISLFLACLIVESSGGKIFKRFLMIALIIFNIIFVQINNSYWIKASQINEEAIKQIKTITGSDREIIFVNVPGEYRGAYIFRNSFIEAMLLNRIDTHGIKVANYMNHAEYSLFPGKILPEMIADSLCFGKSVKMSGTMLSIINFDKPHEPVKLMGINKHAEIWFWDKHQFVQYIQH